MTRISGANGTSIPAGKSGIMQESDAVINEIQRKLANAQKQLHELSANTEMSAEQKMKKRQDIQKQISELSNQLRQHEIDMRKERQQAEALPEKRADGGNKETSMQSIISSDSAMKLAQVQGSVASQLEGKAAVLKVEIKQDDALGGTSRMKREELAKAEEMAAKAQASQVGTLSKASSELADAGTKNKTDETNKETLKEEQPGEAEGNVKQDSPSAALAGTEEAAPGAVTYRKIDISL